MKTLSKELKTGDFDHLGRAGIPDHICAEVVTSSMGYGTKPCFVIVSGKRKRADATYGRYSSFVTLRG